MVGYGALIDSDFMNQLNNALSRLANTLSEVPFYWYIAALTVMFLFFQTSHKKIARHQAACSIGRFELRHRDIWPSSSSTDP